MFRMDGWCESSWGVDYPNAHKDLDELKVNDAFVSEQSRHQMVGWSDVMWTSDFALGADEMYLLFALSHG